MYITSCSGHGRVSLFSDPLWRQVCELERVFSRSETQTHRSSNWWVSSTRFLLIKLSGDILSIFLNLHIPIFHTVMSMIAFSIRNRFGRRGPTPFRTGHAFHFSRYSTQRARKLRSMNPWKTQKLLGFLLGDDYIFPDVKSCPLGIPSHSEKKKPFYGRLGLPIAQDCRMVAPLGAARLETKETNIRCVGSPSHQPMLVGSKTNHQKSWGMKWSRNTKPFTVLSVE